MASVHCVDGVGGGDGVRRKRLVQPCVPRDATSTVAAPTATELVDGRPVLTIGEFDWNHPTFWWPRDLHQFAAYQSGELIRFEYTADGRLTVKSSNVDLETLNGWLELADAAGLATVDS